MFPLFRKGKEPGKPSAPPGSAEPLGRATTSRLPLAEPRPEAGTPSAGGIQVNEIDLALSPEVEEAVMLYAGGRVGDATAALNRFILDHPDSREIQPWHMLFDIYEATGQHQPFDDLALDFAVRFERSPPTWRFLGKRREAMPAQREPSFAFAATLTPQDKARLQHFLQEAGTVGTVAVDFSKTPVPSNESQARTILECLSRLVAMGKAVRVVGGEAFVVRLSASKADHRLGESGWLLLLMVLQLLGKAEAFETTALDFAMEFEISPPSYVTPKLAAEDHGEEGESCLAPSGQVFPLAGVLNAGNIAVFDGLRQFAEPRRDVEIDLGRVERIDFSVVGLLMDTVMGLAEGGRGVVFRDGNEMVNLLLHMVGIGQYATIHSRSRK